MSGVPVWKDKSGLRASASKGAGRFQMPRGGFRSPEGEGRCHKSWLSKADFTWLIIISHKVCLCFTLCSQLTHGSHMTRTCVLSLCYDWLMFLWLTIVSHNDVMTFARDSHYKSRVSRRWRALCTWHVLCFMIGLRHVAQWLIGVIWWISGMTHYES